MDSLTRPIKLVIFDHDMTIVDSSYSIMAGFNAVADAVGRPRVDHEKVMRYIATPIAEFCEGLLGEYRPEWTDLYWEKVPAFEPKLIRTFPDTVPTLKRLREMGLLLAVASNREAPRLAMERVGIAPFFDVMAGAMEPYGHLPYKPDPAMVNALLADLKVPPGQALYVGDDRIDIETAHRAGVRGVGITRGNFTREQFMEMGAWRVIDSLEELIGIVQENFEGEERPS